MKSFAFFCLGFFKVKLLIVIKKIRMMYKYISSIIFFVDGLFGNIYKINKNRV